jgi:short subunit dehydrogenase-like uncharacterized protein
MSGFDVVVYGASGFTGRLVAEYLAQRVDAAPLRWAMAGRSLDKLAAVRDEIGAPADTPLMRADGDDPASLKALVGATKVVLTTVGPYQLYGTPLVEACARAGTGYVDLCGEPAWMRQMIDAHDTDARTSGARIVFSCGFDSIPFDLGVAVLQDAARQRFGVPCTRVKGRVMKMKGKFSGGTAASLKATMAAAAKDPAILETLRNPFALAPGFAGPKQPAGNKPLLDEDLGLWTAPFVMAPINTRNVHRSNFLAGHPYGTDFVYDEMLVTGPGEQGQALAERVAGDRSLGGEDGPKPGEGPTREEREKGSYDVLFLGTTADGRRLKARVIGDRDPGYGSTSKMTAEAAIHLARATDIPAGITTPAAAFGLSLIGPLTQRAGMTFTIVD